jgi:hypothetical protein
MSNADAIAEALRPVEPFAGVDRQPALVEMDLKAVAVVLDLMQPALAGWRLAPQRCELGRNESRYLRRLRALDHPRQETRFGTPALDHSPTRIWPAFAAGTYISGVG